MILLYFNTSNVTIQPIAALRTGSAVKFQYI